MEAVTGSSSHLYKQKNKGCNIKPEWNTFLEHSHVEARHAFKAWAVAGKPRFGPEFVKKKRATAKFKYALRYIKRNENTLQADYLFLIALGQLKVGGTLSLTHLR